MNKWNFYTSKEIKPDGWLRRQLQIQASGLAGNLDNMWRDVKDSKWIGGDAEGWERVPYWLDGFIPLAYLLEDEDMIARAKKYVDAIIAGQEEDGWICPCPKDARAGYDTWAIQLITKVLTVYYECSGDERVPDVIYKALKNYYELLSNGTIKLFEWGESRWFECFIAINFIYRRCGEEWLVELARILKEQGRNYSDYMDSWWQRSMYGWMFETHIVNIGMMFKSEAVSHEILGEEYTDEAERRRTLLDRLHGTPVGLFTGDECLTGLSPIQGTELCGVVEQMYSYEHLFAVTGDHKWAERLETIAFNALPATISDDMWTHQYDQMSNQMSCKEFEHRAIFSTNSKDAHLFGLEPNYGCCTANFGQGWPKFALSAFMHDGDKVINVIPVPSTLSDDGIYVKVQTEYPFKNSIKYTVKAEKDFTFVARVPSFAENVTVNGEAAECGELTFDIFAGDEREITVEFSVAPKYEKRYYGLGCVRYGSLVFSVPVKYEKKMREYVSDGVERKFPYCDYEYLPVSDWNYAYSSDKYDVVFRDVSDIPFSSYDPPIALRAKVKKIRWELENGYEVVCSKAPVSTEPIGDEEEILLYPYGCAKLRMTEIPMID